MTVLGLRRTVVAPLLAIAVLACSGGERTAVGIVIDVRGATLTRVDGFTLRTSDGQLLEFLVGRLDTGPNFFQAVHLREHQGLGLRVAVGYREEDGVLVAFRLADAP